MENHLKSRRIRAAKAALLAFVLSIATSVFADLPAAKLTCLYPPGGKSGASVDVTAVGADLDGATELRFSIPGITAKAVDGSEGDTERKFTVTISPDVAPGFYEARVVGKTGITNPRGFVVGDMPEIVPSAKDKDKEPTELPLDTVANGRCQNNIVDEYALDLKQGQRVVIQCEARAIDSKIMPEMTLTSPQGAEIARGHRGALIDITAPSDGKYLLRVHDLLYKGGNEYCYRVCAGTRPYIDSIYPPVAAPGSKGKFTILGRNLPGGKQSAMHSADGKSLDELETEIEVPKEPTPAAKADALALLGPIGAGLDAVSWRLKSDKGVSNPVLIGLAQAPVVTEQEPNDSPDKAQQLSLPCEVVGRFYPHGDRDFYTFEADKGEVYWISVISTRLGQHTSPELLVQAVGKTDKGEAKVSDVQDIGGPDMQPMGKRGGGASAAFPAPSRDIEYRLETKEAGIYRLMVRDLFDESGDNASHGYALLIHKQTPDFHLVVTTAPLPNPNANVQDPALTPPLLHKDGVSVLRVNVLRTDGFEGEVRVEAQGLPPGVKCEPATVPADESVANLVLTADDGAQNWLGNFRIVGKAKVGDNDESRDARIGAITWPSANGGNGNTEHAQIRLDEEMPLAVNVDENDQLTMEVSEKSLESKPDAKIHLSVKVKRHGEMKQPLKISLAGFPKPSNNGNKSDATIAPDADSATIDVDLTPQKLSPGTYTLYLVAQSQLKIEKKAKGDKKGQTTDTLGTFFSPPIQLTVTPKEKDKEKSK